VITASKSIIIFKVRHPSGYLKLIRALYRIWIPTPNWIWEVVPSDFRRWKTGRVPKSIRNGSIWLIQVSSTLFLTPKFHIATIRFDLVFGNGMWQMEMDEYLETRLLSSSLSPTCRARNSNSFGILPMSNDRGFWVSRSSLLQCR